MEVLTGFCCCHRHIYHLHCGAVSQQINFENRIPYVSWNLLFWDLGTSPLNILDFCFYLNNWKAFVGFALLWHGIPSPFFSPLFCWLGLGLDDILKPDLIMPLLEALPLEQDLTSYLPEASDNPLVSEF